MYVLYRLNLQYHCKFWFCAHRGLKYEKTTPINQLLKVKKNDTRLVDHCNLSYSRFSKHPLLVPTLKCAEARNTFERTQSRITKTRSIKYFLSALFHRICSSVHIVGTKINREWYGFRSFSWWYFNWTLCNPSHPDQERATISGREPPKQKCLCFWGSLCFCFAVLYYFFRFCPCFNLTIILC